MQALEYATGVTAEVVGKPEKTFFHEAIRSLDVTPQNTVMIGDVRLQLLPNRQVTRAAHHVSAYQKIK